MRRLFPRTADRAMLASPQMKRWENAMRISLLALGAGLVLASLPVASDAQRADNDILPQSVALMNQGQAAQAKGDLDAAIDAYESALAADPRNRSAIIALAQVARRACRARPSAFIAKRCCSNPTTSPRWRGRAKRSPTRARSNWRAKSSPTSSGCARINARRSRRSKRRSPMATRSASSRQRRSRPNPSWQQ